MRLNGATFNGSRLNVGPVAHPVAFSADSVGVVASMLEAIRYANSSGDATAITLGDFQASAQRYFAGDLVGNVISDLPAIAIRNGAGSAVLVGQGGMYYTRLIYGSGGAEIQIIAISDVGVVYGSGEGVATPLAEMSGTRARVGAGDSIATTGGELEASAIRIPATAPLNDSLSMIAQLDSAHITGGGVRYIDGFGDAYGYLELEDGGFKRQVFIGSLDLEPLAYVSATAIRHSTGDAIINTATSGTFQAVRRAEGAGLIIGAAELAGESIVRGSGDAIISILASMTGYVYRRGGVLEAISTIASEITIIRKRFGAGSAPLVCTVSGSGSRKISGGGAVIIEINAESDESVVNYSAMDDDDELFYRPAAQREFSRAAPIREWSRR